MSVECEQAGVGGFVSQMNPLSWNAAESNATSPRWARNTGAGAPRASRAWCAGALLPSAPTSLSSLRTRCRCYCCCSSRCRKLLAEESGERRREPELPSWATPGSDQSAHSPAGSGIGAGPWRGAGGGGGQGWAGPAGNFYTERT